MKIARQNLTKAAPRSLTTFIWAVIGFTLTPPWAGASSPTQAQFAQSQFEKGMACWNRRQLKEAIAFFGSAIATQPTMAAAYESRAACYLQMEKFDAALPDVNKALALSPKMALAYADRATIYNERGNSRLALIDFTRAIEFSKDNPNWVFYRNRGSLYKESGADEKALADYSAALKLKPEEIWVHYYRACIYFKQGRYKDALADVSVSIRQDSSEEKGKLYQLRAKCYEKLGQPSLAKKDRDAASAEVDFDWVKD